MKINKLHIVNFRLFQSLDIAFTDQNINVIIGANGAGKTSVLDAIALTFAHIQAKYKSDEDKYVLPISIEKKDISIGKNECVLEGFYNIPNNLLLVRASKFINQTSSSHHLDPLPYFEETTKKLLDNEINSLPILSYYRTTRNQLNKSETTKNDFYFNDLLEGYKDSIALNKSPFQDFEEWYIDQENLENELKISKGLISYEIVQLKLLRKVITELFSDLRKEEFKGLAGRRNSKNPQRKNSNISSGLVLIKENEEIHINSLSSGEKNLILLFADIARRLTVLNKNSEDSLLGNGIVLIDEIELHLHPKWQRYVISNLSKAFPNIQFIVTTHSPQILSGVKQSQISILENLDILAIDSAILGRDSNGILKEVFQTNSRPDKVTNIIDEIYLQIEKENIQEAKALLGELKLIVESSDPMIMRITNTLQRISVLKK